MATATLTLTPSTVKDLQKVTANLTVTNGGGTAVLVQAIAPFAAVSGQNTQAVPVQMGAPFIPPNGNSVPAGGSLSFSWDLIPYAPWSGSSFVEATFTQMLFSIGCNVQMSDGTSAVPTAATLTVNSQVS